MIDHVGLNVSDLAAAKAFYAETLEPLGYRVWAAWESHEVVGYAADESGPDFWIYTRGDEPSAPTHVSFRARDRETVDAFHAAGLAAGGTDNGAPGVRPHYHDQYYGAFVLDHDGNNIEAVCHSPA
ncbi:MAG TPA: VOC family protein [Gaiellaceae bacterium]|jgi:catechol 2,3-dioxygenase-like lactoylglutathione lyase family enzyme|nr:VOC family protein [Gaiellaceae bacterium]